MLRRSDPDKLLIVVHAFSQTTLGKRRSPVGEQPVLLGCTSHTGQSRNISRKARKGRKAQKSDYLPPS